MKPENIKENIVKQDILIDSLKYLPDFLQDKDLMKDAAKLLDACISQEDDVLSQIHEAYCDTLYKIAGYQQLTYAAKTELLKEKGFGYLLNLLKYIYEERYNALPKAERKKQTLEQYIEKQTASNLANITMLFNLLYILKGKTLGLELCLDLVNCPEFIYLTWDIVANYKGTWPDIESLPLPGGEVEVKKGDAYTVALNDGLYTDVIFNGVSWHKCTTYKNYLTPRQQFTAELTIWGIASAQLQAQIAEFVRYYMLPYIEVKLEFTDEVPTVLAFPSGDRSILRTFKYSNYFDDKCNFIHENLSHQVSDNHWGYGETATDITMGKPIFNDIGFNGKVDLNTSFVKNSTGVHHLYGETKSIPDFITGHALESLTDEGTISFNGDYVQAPLQRDYVLTDIVTGKQINPHYEGEEFIRDTIVRYNTCLLIEGIHHAKTVNQMNALNLWEFDHYLDEAEVWAGRKTDVHCVNDHNVILFETTTPWVREKTGFEPTIHLEFADAFVTDYTGIGDLGILGSNTYFIYDSMLFKNDNGDIVQVGNEDTWTDIGASHAVSEQYFTPGIKEGKLFYVKEDFIAPIHRDLASYGNYKSHVREIDMPVEVVDDLEVEKLEDMKLEDFHYYLDLSYWDNIESKNWTHVTGYVNENYSAFAICDGYLYRIYLKDNVPQFELYDQTQGWTYITGSYYANTYRGYGIKNNVLYTLGEDVKPVMYNEQPLVGWDSSFDCISRYHHSNDEYITYGICAGKLYAIQNEEVTLISNETGWTATCGYYNDNSPRTFAYALKNGALYELQGKEIVLKDNTHNWTDISGCTTSTVTFVLGIADGNLYRFNAKTMELVDEGGWTDVFGRYTTSTSKSNNCYGYGVKDRRLHVLHKDNEIIVPGMWKINGEGAGIDLRDYNISDISVLTPSGVIHGIENVRTQVPVADEDPSTYNIDITYETIGFEDNHRYQIKTEMSDVYRTYINPENCRDDVSMAHAPEWNPETGVLTNFTECPLIIHGKQKINGNGDAYEFSKDNYLELPKFENITEVEFDVLVEEIPYQEIILKIGAIIADELLPIVLDAQGNTGIYYGYCSDLQRYGIFAKTVNSYVRIAAVAKDDNKDMYVKFNKHAEHYDLSYSDDGITYTPIEHQATQTMNCPKYLGGNGTIYGDGIVFLNECQATTDKTFKFYEKGKYISVNTLQQDLEERIITGEPQECQKIIEIQKENGKKVIDLEMDSMYTTRSFESNAKQLNICDEYAYNTLHYGENEGINTSTMVYSGEYTLDPEKAQDRGNIKANSGYGINAIADKFNVIDYIDISPEQQLVIETGDNVDNQILWQTEEHNAYTNKYLLTAEATCVHSRNKAHTDPSGIMFELHTDIPGVQTKQLEYNAEEFAIDETKIENSALYNFDTYTAIMSGFTSVGMEGLSCTLPLNLKKKSQTGNKTYYNVKPMFAITTGDTFKQKMAQFGDEDIIIGNKETVYVDEDDNIIAPEDLGEYVPIEQKQYYEEEDLEEVKFYTTKTLVDEEVFNWEENTAYDLVMDISREARGVQHIQLHETQSTEPKDKFQFVDGVISNFSEENYIIADVIGDMVICFIADDDVSKDQGLFGVPNKQSVCIKDHKFTLCDENGKAIETSDEFLEDHDKFFIKVIDRICSVSNDNENWYQLFETPLDVEQLMWIGYASAGSGMIPFNGTIDLTRSMITEHRLYDFTQITNITANGKPCMVIETPYAVNEIQFGFDFAGTLDCYRSELLLPYTLEWLEDRKSINKVIRQELSDADPSYDPELDKNDYQITEYGVHLEDKPQRWDNVNITYTTVDHAYYMEPNTKYYLKNEIEISETGKCLLTKVGNPSWKSAVVGNFTQNDYYTFNFTNEKYIVLHCTTKDIVDQSLCGYVDNNSQSICIKDGKWQYFDDANYHVICDAKANQDIYFKLYMTPNKIEYKEEDWVISDITAGFSGYDTFIIGKSNGKAFNGTINLNDSFTVTDNINYLFGLYKKITPCISTNGKNWTPIVIEPMLTLRNMVSFGQGFNGKLFLYDSNLLLEEATYWTANQVNIYAMYDMPEDDIKANELVKCVLLDNLVVDPSKYWTEDVTVKVNPQDIQLYVEGLPLVGDVIDLTYDTWYLFRKYNHEYDFRMTHVTKYLPEKKTAQRVVVSYIDLETQKEYIIYEMARANYIVNTGYNFWGSLSVKDSYRGHMMLCDYLEWCRYQILYKKQEETEWTKWNEFSVEARYNIYVRTGFKLHGPLYMETSFVKLNNLVSPFLAYWDGTYITVVGGVNLDNGVASIFSDNDYLQMVMRNIHEGDLVSFDIELADVEDQGLGTSLRIQDEYICSGDKKLQKVYPGYKACVEYWIENGEIHVRVIGRNTCNFKLHKAKAYTLTVIPYNKDLQEYQDGYYVKSIADAKKLKVYYRVGDDTYNHSQPPQLTWYPAALEKVDNIKYFGQELQNIYVAQIPLGYAVEQAQIVNTNPYDVEYLDNEPVEYKIVSEDGLTTTNHTTLYNNRIEKQRTLF